MASPPPTRIVSMLASATEFACALGLAEAVVGISHECDHPAEILDRPRVSRPRFDPESLSSGDIDLAVRAAMLEHGGVYEIDLERLESLDPDLVITQAVCEVCAVPTIGVVEALRERRLGAAVLSLDAHSLDDIVDSFRSVGRAGGVPARGEVLAREMEARIESAQRTCAGASRPRVLALEWLDPPFAPGHWVPEMIATAGGVDIIGTARRPSAEMEWDALAELEPDALIVMPCGYGVDAAARDADSHAARLAAVAPRAIAEGRSWVVDASAFFNRSGPRVVTGIEILAGLLHPDLSPAPPPGTFALWQPHGAGLSTGKG